MKKEMIKGEESRQSSFMSGVMVLSLSTLLVKIIGLAFKIPMLSFLGTEGMGYFNSAYEIYALLCVVATAGLPTALSMLVSTARAKGNGTELKSTFRKAVLLFLIMGVLGSGGMLALAQPLSKLIANPDAYLSILAIAPALLFICLASAVRGYCQGFGSMTPTAVSQLIEALSKLGFGILFAYIALDRGYGIPAVAAFAVLGITLGTFISAVYLAVARGGERYRVECKKDSRGDGDGTLKRLVAIALPVTLGSLVMGLTRIIDMALIMRRLQDIGISVAESNKIYGAYTTLAVPVFSLIPALITPISMALIPELSASLEQADSEREKRVVDNAMRLTAVFAIPAALGLTVFARPVLELLFRGEGEAIGLSAPLLSVLGASVAFSCLITTTNAILQSHRRVYLPIVSMAVGVVIKLAVSYLLIGNSRLGALGAPIGSLACSIAVTVLNLYFMGKYTYQPISMKNVFFKPLAASAAAIGGALAVYIPIELRTDSRVSSLMLAIAVAVGIYFVLSVLMGSIGAEDIQLLPFGKKILRYMTKKQKNIGGRNDCLRKEKDAATKRKLRR